MYNIYRIHTGLLHNKFMLPVINELVYVYINVCIHICTYILNSMAIIYIQITVDVTRLNSYWNYQTNTTHIGYF